VNSVLLTLNSAATVINSISGGMVGQRLLIVDNNSSGTFTVSTAGNILYSGMNTGSVVTISASGGTVELVKVTNGQWCVIGR